MKPNLELVQVRDEQSAKVWSHRYSYQAVRWHLHLEYESDLVIVTNGDGYVEASGAHRIALFVGILDLIGHADQRVPLASTGPQPDRSAYPSAAMNLVLQHIGRDLGKPDLACRHLGHVDLTITEIRHAVGFNNVSNSDRHFLAAKGVPPSRLRVLGRDGRRFASAA